MGSKTYHRDCVTQNEINFMIIITIWSMILLRTHLDRIEPAASCKKQEKQGESSDPLHQWVLLLHR
jgi:hypothetical protein